MHLLETLSEFMVGFGIGVMLASLGAMVILLVGVIFHCIGEKVVDRWQK